MADSIMDDYSDLTELGIDVNENDALSIKFDKCVKHIQSIAGTLDNEILLKLYGFYKQSLEGPCNTSKPSWYDMKGKAKWEAWKGLGDLDKGNAKSKYIEVVLAISPHFSFDEAGNMADSWVKVSSPVQEPVALDKNISDYIRSGDAKYVTEYLKSNKDSKDDLDSSGMGLIHYASDIGNLKILEILLEAGCDMNLQDGEGQTALHYAATCGHADCILFLLNKGARSDIEDSDGCRPAEVACTGEIKALLE